MKKKVALIVGGMGSERTVSLSTGKAFEAALKVLGYEYLVIDAQQDFPKRLMDAKCDVALLALHGKFAEDGTVQGICEYLKIPYSGSGVLTSALCMNKITTKQVVMQNGIVSPEYEVVDTRSDNIKTHQTKLKFPLVVKPAREGSSVGVSICKTSANYQEALAVAAKHDCLILLERFIEGPEVTVSLFKGKALVPIEICPHEDFYNFENKYTKGKTDYIMPARISEKAMKECKEIAEKVYRICDIRTYARVDFRVEHSEKPLMIEVNTLPGCTENSLLPKAAKQEGIPFETIIQELIESATLDYAGVI